jgi:GxxExxY protein
MNNATAGLKHVQLTDAIIHAFYAVYNEMGYGFLESCYEGAMELALTQAGLKVRRQVQIDVWFRGHKVGVFFADLLVNDAIILELKCTRAIDPGFEAQLLNYLRATVIEVGMLLNFGPKPEFKRLAFDNERKKVPASTSDACESRLPLI